MSDEDLENIDREDVAARRKQHRGWKDLSGEEQANQVCVWLSGEEQANQVCVWRLVRS